MERPSFFDLDVSDYLDHEGFDYRRSSGSSGEQLNVKTCPHCGNGNWKVYLNADSGLGNCFVCGEGFNRWKFAAHHIGVNIKDGKAISNHLAEIERSLGFRPKVKKLAIEVEIPDAVLPMSFALPGKTGWNHPYLEARGITGHYAAEFKLRFCLQGFHTYSRDNQKRRQVFDNRIIVPVFDTSGELVTFQGRDVTGQSDQKYLFPAQMPATGRYLYNGHVARVRRAKHIIINEGVFDVIPVAIACDQYEIMRDIVPVGSFGKHLSPSAGDKPSQVDALLQLKQQAGLEAVTIMWDGESEALSAALTACEKINGIGLKASIALLPAGKDPNEVDACVIRDAFLNAKPWTRTLAVRWKARNPYEDT